MEIYNIIFDTFDSISTGTFLASFTVTYLACFPLVHLVLSQNDIYCKLGKARQSYIQCKLLEVGVFIFLCYMGIMALVKEDIHLFDTTNHRQNPQVMINMATVYTVKDVVEMVINKKMTRTTYLHHSCVVLAYFHVQSVLHGDYNVEGIFKVLFINSHFLITPKFNSFQCFLYYGAFTALNFPYKLFLAIRFFVDRSGKVYSYMKTLTIIHKILCVLINFYWQFFYVTKLVDVVSEKGYIVGEFSV